MKAQLIKAGLIVGAIVAFFLIGRFTAPKTMKDRQPLIDSLTLRAENAEKALDIALVKMKTAENVSKEHIERATQEQAEKILYKKKYEAAITRNHGYTPTQLDSAILAEFSGFH